MNESLTYTNGFSEMLAPLLVLIRSTGFFEAYVFMPVMTIASLFLFLRLRRALDKNGTYDEYTRGRYPRVWQFAYFTLCFIATNSTAVAFKTMILEETDYETIVWFLPWVSPLHFFITSVAVAMLWVVWRNRSTWLDKAACVYTQIGMFGGYYIAVDRLLNEPFDLTDPTSGVSGIFFFLWFGVLNWDIAIRYFKAPYRSAAQALAAHQKSEGYSR